MTKFTKIAGIIALMLLSVQSAFSACTPKGGNMQFIENKGQIVDQNYHANSAVKYLLCRPGFNVQLRQTGFSYDTYSDQPKAATGPSLTKKRQPSVAGVLQATDFTRLYHRVDIELLNCNPNAEIIADGRSFTYYNYFTAGTPQGGVSDVHCYGNVVYKNIYPFIDLEFMSSDNGDPATTTPVEYQFILHPGANISDIQLSYKGANEVSLDKGQLNVKVATGAFTEKIPSSYIKTNGRQIAVRYLSSGNNIYSFAMEHPFIITSDIVIDPTPCFVWGTFYGGNGWDIGSGIALDSSNNVYMAGSTTSTNNIATAGAYQTTFSGNDLYDIYLGKFNPTGTTLIWGTYYGGDGDDGENGLAIDTSGVYLTGYAHSAGCSSPGAWQTTCPNCNETYCDILVAKFSLTGGFVWGTYYGTSGYGQGNDIVVDTSGVYITGETQGGSTGFSTSGAWQTTYGGALDPFVAKFNLSGSQLLWGTYYGGNVNAFPWGITLDSSGNIYIAGWTTYADSTLITKGAYQTTQGGGYEGFVAKFNHTGSSLLYGTFFGGPGDDEPYDIRTDAHGNAYFEGWTTSTSGIATPGAYQTVNGAQNAFVAKLNAAGDSLLWGTYYGGGIMEDSREMALDAYGNIYITGATESPTGIATAGAYQTTLNGSSNAFIAKFNPEGNSLLWGTYYGGTQYDDYYSSYLRPGGIIVNRANDVFITGFSSDFNGIASAGAWQRINGGGYDAFVAKFSCNSVPPVADFASADTSICANDCINFTDMSTGGATSWQWSFPGAMPSTSTDQNPQSICYLSTGDFDVTLVASNSGGTNSVTFSGYIHVNPAPVTPNISQVGNTLFCSTDPSYTNYQWYDSTNIITGATDTFLVITHSGNYNVQVTSANGCKVAVGINVVLGISNLSVATFNIYPNPANDLLTITGLPASGDKELLEVVNVLGQVVCGLRVDQKKEVTIDVSEFSQGVYYIRLGANGNSAIRKFIKE